VGIASSKDGKLLASTDAQQSVKLWDIKKAVELSSARLKEDEWFEHVAFSPDGKTLALAGGSSMTPAWGEVRILEVPTLRKQYALSGVQNAVSSLAHSPDSKLLAVSTTSDQTVTVWDLSTKKKAAVWSTGIAAVQSVAFGPRGDMLVTSGMQPNPANFFATLGEARFWRIKDGHIETREHFAAIRAEGSIDYVAISPDGKLCATGGRFCRLAVWNLLDLRKSD
jgi:WD40 repeat protein